MLSGCSWRYGDRFVPFELIFKYRAGKHNTVADALKGYEVDDINRLYENYLNVKEITVVKEM